MESKCKAFFLVAGFALGDGSLQDRKKTGKASLDIAHHEKHKDYVEFKSKLLTKCGFVNHTKLKINSNGVRLWRCTTRGYKNFGVILKKLGCPQSIPLNWFKFFGSDFLAYLWFDDGCVCRARRKRKDGSIYEYQFGDISTCSWSLKTCENFREWIKNTFDIDTRLHQQKKKYWSIRMNRLNLGKLLQIIKPFAINFPSMLYKTLL